MTEPSQETVTVCGAWHAAWTVECMDRALEFYVGLLGMEIVHSQVQDNEYTSKLVGIPGAKLKAVLLKFPGISAGTSGHVIELMEYLAPKGIKIVTQPCNVGAAHFAFMTRDVKSMHARLVAAGVEFVSEPVAITAGINQGGCVCYLHDPDGFTLELMQPPGWRLEGAERPPLPI